MEGRLNPFRSVPPATSLPAACSLRADPGFRAAPGGAKSQVRPWPEKNCLL